jgi:hypothetical protein
MSATGAKKRQSQGLLDCRRWYCSAGHLSVRNANSANGRMALSLGPMEDFFLAKYLRRSQHIGNTFSKARKALA